MYIARLTSKQFTWKGIFPDDSKELIETGQQQIIDAVPNQVLTIEHNKKQYQIQIKEITKQNIVFSTETLLVNPPKEDTKLEPVLITVPLHKNRAFYAPITNDGTLWLFNLSEVKEKTTLQYKVPKPYLEETQNIIKNLENQIQTKIICYYVSEKYLIGQEHPDYFIDQLRDIGFQDKISLVIFSNGGDSNASLRIATLLRQHCKTLEILVASKCASAATQLALSADFISMGPGGFLTAVDTSFWHELNPKSSPTDKVPYIACDAFKRVFNLLENEHTELRDTRTEGSYSTLFKYIHPIVVGEIDRISRRSEMIAVKMMRMHSSSFDTDQKILHIAHHLVNDYPDHGFPITYEEAKEIGLPVTKMDNNISYVLWDLIKLYRSITRQATTHITNELNHYEENAVVIEILGKRIVKRYSLDERYMANTNKWITQNDKTQWLKLTPNEDPNKPFKVDPIEKFETERILVTKKKTISEAVGRNEKTELDD